MKSFPFSLLLCLPLISLACTQKPTSDEANQAPKDPYLWLEDVEGAKAMDWVKEQNKKSLAELTKTPRFKSLESEALGILQSKDKIPMVSDIGGKHVYNFWQDDKHVRGLWRRTTLTSYKQKRPKWETLLDLDQVAKADKENWVFKGANCLQPQYERCLIYLSRGGKDAIVVKEFSIASKSFVKNGFELPEAKSWVGWYDSQNMFVATDFGAGSMTESGYPRIVKLWKRGTDLSQAKTVFEGTVKDMAAYGTSLFNPEGKISLVTQLLDFYSDKTFVYSGQKLIQVPKPDSAKLLGYFKGFFILELRKPWEVEGLQFAAGSLVAMQKGAVKAGSVRGGDLQLVYSPDEKSSLLTAAILKDRLVLNILENVKGKIYQVNFSAGKFSPPQEMSLLTNGHITLAAASTYRNDFYFSYEGFLTPESLYFYDSIADKYSMVKSLPAEFDSKDMIVKQKWAISQDGTKVPYFLVGKSSVIKDGKAPTLLYGYGGFEVSRTPFYSPTTGKLWLEKGGIYVLANIRGGGEFGPKWHQAALKENRQKAYDDFIAVGEALIDSGVTNKEKLAIMGGSNGGLLVGAVMTQRPDLFKSVVCLVPLLDMIRYSQLLAGASWMAEYGDPRDPKMREVLLSYSPYHNVSKDKTYPKLFLMTSTKDDRVHPGHARKMAAKMEEMGHKNVLYYENTEGGHAASANLQQKARMQALNFEFLFQTLF